MVDIKRRRYWLDAFHGKDWEPFIKMGPSVTGFRKRKEKVARQVRPGDYFLCYLMGIHRFIGVTEALSECYLDDRPIFKTEVLPVRFKIKLVYELEPETAVPILELKDRLFLFAGVTDISALATRIKGCPMEFEHGDGKIIYQAIKDAVDNPVRRDIDQSRNRPSKAEHSEASKGF